MIRKGIVSVRVAAGRSKNLRRLFPYIQEIIFQVDPAYGNLWKKSSFNIYIGNTINNKNAVETKLENLLPELALIKIAFFSKIFLQLKPNIHAKPHTQCHFPIV